MFALIIKYILAMAIISKYNNFYNIIFNKKSEFYKRNFY